MAFFQLLRANYYVPLTFLQYIFEVDKKIKRWYPKVCLYLIHVKHLVAHTYWLLKFN